MTAAELAARILELPAKELVELNRILRDHGFEGGIGVREPRRPAPEDEGWPEPAPLPADYWETAE